MSKAFEDAINDLSLAVEANINAANEHYAYLVEYANGMSGPYVHTFLKSMVDLKNAEKILQRLKKGNFSSIDIELLKAIKNNLCVIEYKHKDEFTCSGVIITRLNIEHRRKDITQPTTFYLKAKIDTLIEKFEAEKPQANNSKEEKYFKHASIKWPDSMFKTDHSKIGFNTRRCIKKAIYFGAEIGDKEMINNFIKTENIKDAILADKETVTATLIEVYKTNNDPQFIFECFNPESELCKFMSQSRGFGGFTLFKEITKHFSSTSFDSGEFDKLQNAIKKYGSQEDKIQLQRLVNPNPTSTITRKQRRNAQVELHKRASLTL